ncbi:MAG: hypothetical protein JW807_16650 [Spirochaetes bacterium]|nr:hypothetical protein [Spirochaetota bacterium]
MSLKELTSAEIATALKISPGRVRQLAGLGILPRTPNGGYVLSFCKKAFFDYKKRVHDAGDESTYLEYLKISNDLMEMQNRVMRGEFLHRDDFISTTGARVQSCRSRLLIIPTKASLLLIANDDAGCLSILRRMVTEARRELETDIDFLRIAKSALKDKKRR